MLKMSEFSVTPFGTVSPYCKNDLNCPGFMIKCGDKKVLLDCGNGISRLMKFPDDLRDLIIIISHLHEDHYGDLGCITNAAFCYNRLGEFDEKIKVYLPYGWKWEGSNFNARINDMLNLGNMDGVDYCENGYLAFGHNSKSQYFLPLEYGDMKISFLKNLHDILTFSVRIVAYGKSLVYTADTGYNENLIEFSKNADLLISESTFLKGQNCTEGHMYAWQAGLLARKAKVKKLALTHFWPEIDKQLYVLEAKEYFKNTVALREGKRLILRRES